MPQASVTVYVRDTTIGQVPVPASLLATTRFASVVQTSLMLRPSASRPDTVVSAAGAALAEQPSTVVAAIVPVIAGAVVSSILIV